MRQLDERIDAAIRATKPGTKARNKALANVKWQLRTPLGLVVGIGTVAPYVALLVDSADLGPRQCNVIRSRRKGTRRGIVECRLTRK